MSKSKEIIEAAHDAVSWYREYTGRVALHEKDPLGRIVDPSGVDMSCAKDTEHAVMIRLARKLGRWAGGDFGHFTDREPSRDYHRVFVCPEFGTRLEGLSDGQLFRRTFLRELDNDKAWSGVKPYICFDFSGVEKITPSFANAAFGHFRKYVSANDIREMIVFDNISDVKREIINIEINEGDCKHKETVQWSAGGATATECLKCGATVKTIWHDSGEEVFEANEVLDYDEDMMDLGIDPLPPNQTYEITAKIISVRKGTPTTDRSEDAGN